MCRTAAKALVFGGVIASICCVASLPSQESRTGVRSEHVELRGYVRYAKTDEPVQNADVCLRALSCSMLAQAVSGEDGSFRMSVDPSDLPGADEIWCDHPQAFSSFTRFDPKGPKQGLVLKIARAPVVRGIVQDTGGDPLPGVVVSSGFSRRCENITTGPDGDFAIVAKAASDPMLQFRKRGFRPHDIGLSRPRPRDVRVSLERLPSARGRVTGPDSTPVTSFEVYLGLGRARPLGVNTVRATISDEDGRFDISPPAEYFGMGFETYDKAEEPADAFGIYWLGIVAPGLAPWETVLTAEAAQEELTVNMRAGVNVSGRLELPAGASELKVHLLPSFRREILVGPMTVPGVVMAAKSVEPDADGSFRFRHVAEGSHEIYVFGKGVTPAIFPVEVGERDLALGTVKVLGTGILSGRVIDREGLPLASADLELSMLGLGLPEAAGGPGDLELEIPITTNVKGHFRAEGVPAGDLILSHFWTWHMCASVHCVVSEGKETTVVLDLREQSRLRSVP